eukprot:4183481-Amphidinium_carterae.1
MGNLLSRSRATCLLWRHCQSDGFYGLARTTHGNLSYPPYQRLLQGQSFLHVAAQTQYFLVRERE